MSLDNATPQGPKDPARKTSDPTLPTVEPKVVPPEAPQGAPSTYPVTADEALRIDDSLKASYYEAISGTEPIAEIDLANAPPQRFDEAAPFNLRQGEQLRIPTVTGQPYSPANPQVEFWSHHTIHKNAAAAKLREAGRPDLAQSLEDCHSHYTVAVCRDCGRTVKFPNRCDTFYCPECQPRLAHERAESVGWWARQVQQPKHVVLTARNTPDLTPEHVKEFKDWWKKLRRRKVARHWQGGFYSLEVTNEGRGWHLHLHALIDARWIDAGQLATEWASVTAGAGHIVRVKDSRQADYLHEVTKYCVKGSMLAKWTGPDIAAFIGAFTGQRTFGVFGSLYGKRTEFADWLKTLRDEKPKCECGSSNIAYYSEAEFLTLSLQPNPTTAPRPPDHGDKTLPLPGLDTVSEANHAAVAS